jgi:putative membrane-bound dehydrogenase-like protein
MSLLAACGKLTAADVAGPLEPEASLAQLQVEPGMAVELVACEPEVVDPIAIRFDEDGRLWVVEMRDYPNGPPDGKKPLSRIVILTDADDDGRFETSRVFADGLLFPTGIQPWQGGVFVTLAGAVAYLKDTDGDGRADRHDVWYRGFAEENPQLRANHPRLGLDGRVYVANGLRGGEVVDARRSADVNQKPVSISGRDFCFEPHTGDFEAVSGNGQFGLAFDDFGNRFVCNNRAPLQHVVLENRHLARNPFLAVSSVIHDVAAAGERSRVYPLVAAWTTSNLHAGQFTAACGVEIYRGDALGDEYRGNAFVCEPTGSLVHREVLARDGVTFVSHAPREGEEFLASREAWFRPVNLEVGPDGALYVVDMYRAVIEHPQFMPSELANRPDLRRGDDRGRIYRIVRAGSKPARMAPKLSARTSAELVEVLRHKNAWWRETAARLLFERQDPSVQGALDGLAESGTDACSRIQALWLLENLGALSSETIKRALADQDPRVREQGVVLCETRLTEGKSLAGNLIALSADADPGVRFRVALALGGLSDGAIVEPLVAIALARADDPWMRAAVATALPTHTGAILVEVLRSPAAKPKPQDAAEVVLARELATIVGARRDTSDIAKIVALVTDEGDPTTAPAREAGLLGLAVGLERRGATLDDLAGRLAGADELSARLASVFARVARDAANQRLSESMRGTAIDLLKHSQSDRACDVLIPIAAESTSQALRIRAAGALAGQTSARVGPALVASYASQTPAVRRAILDALVARADRAGLLLDELAAKRIARGEIDAARENRLTNHPDGALRKRARELLAAAPPAERKRVLDEYQQALGLPSDPRAGKELFRQHCAVCHHIAGLGVDVAPDISDSRVKTPEQLLVDILNPNQAIDNNYVSYTVAMQDGSVHSGIIAGETASSLTLRQAENKTLDLLRADVEAIRSSGASLMPEGFEKQLSQQQMADLISFIKNWRYLDK